MNDRRYTIKNMPAEERPREKLLAKGPSCLSNAELIAILIRNGTHEVSATALAERLLSADERGLLFFNDSTPEELCAIDGIGPAKAATLMAAAELGRRLMTMPRNKKINIAVPEDIASLFMEDMRYLKKEHFKVLLLNTKNEIIMIEEVSVGSLKTSEAHPREVFSAALRRCAASVILVHNHPSGNPEPSQADIDITERLALAGEIMGIRVLDHIIIGDGIFVSLKREGKFC